MLLDGWRYGLPCVTTCIGAESMTVDENDASFGGLIANSSQDIVDSAIHLYTSQQQWQKAQVIGFETLKKRFHSSRQVLVTSAIDYLFTRNDNDERNIDTMRRSDYLGNMLWNSNQKYTEYFSKWIEAKNKKQ